MTRHGLLLSVAALLAAVEGAMGQAVVSPPTTGQAVVSPPTTLPPTVGAPVGTPVGTPQGPITISGPAEGWSQPLEEGMASSPRLWVTTEYLLWWIRSAPVSTPLVSTSTNLGSTNSAGLNNSGGVGVPGTVILFGDKNIDYPSFSGGRLSVGGFLNDSGTLGIMGRGFLLQQQSVRSIFSSDPNGAPLIGNPIFDVANAFGGGANSLAVSTAGVPGAPLTGGSETVVSRSQLWGMEANGVINLYRTNSFMVNGLVGFRYLDLREDLTLTAMTNDLSDPSSAGFFGTLTSIDTFRTRNQFYGGQLGLDATAWMSSFFFNVAGRFAMGTSHQVLDINGVTIQTAPTFSNSLPGGTYALPSNIGRFRHEAFAVVPELEGKVGYSVMQNLQLFVGYNFLYCSNVIRPANQIDGHVDVRQVPSLPPVSAGGVFIPGFVGFAPTHLMRQSDFWAQGINFGVNLSF